MSARDLWPELDWAAKNLSPEHLKRLGITVDHAVAAGGLGAALITPLSDGLFEPGGNMPVCLLPVFAGPKPEPGAQRPDNCLIDIAAIRFSEPGEIWLRRGDADLLHECAADELYLEEPLRIHRTALSWLQAGAEGCVVLDWKRAAPRLRTVATLIVEDTAHGQTVRHHLQQQLRIPQIQVPQSTVEMGA